MKNLYKWVLMSAIALSIPLLGAAQNRTVTGIVSDAQGPVAGAAVVVKGATNIGTVTGGDGSFTLSVPASAAELSVSFMGYNPQDVAIAGRSNISITLVEDAQAVEEIVIVGYGTTPGDIPTAPTTAISGAKLATAPVTTAAQAITGKLAGVNVVTQSGAPGADVNITVRGGTSITQGTKPLYVVDGFQMEDGLRFVDINDIASIAVLKDASATAIYGARGSNGVILITTKSGRKGQTTVSYNGYMSFERLGKKMDMLSPEEYVSYQYDRLTQTGNMAAFPKYFGGGNVSDPGFYTGAANYISSTYGDASAIDWQDELFGGTAVMQNHNVSISGGDEKTSFILSYNNTNQNGILDKSAYAKNNVRAKIDHQVRDWLKVDLTTNFNNIERDGTFGLGGWMRGAMLMPAHEGTLFTRDEVINTTKVYETMLADFGSYNVFNPLVLNDAITNRNLTRQFSVNAGVTIDLPKNFTWRTAGSYFWQQSRGESWDDGRTPDAIGKHSGTPYGSRNNSERFNWQITNTIDYALELGANNEHRITALLGQEVYETESMKLDNTYDGFDDVNFGLDNLSSATSFSRESSLSTTRMMSFFGRAMYNYKGRYMFTATLRNDGSSKFAEGNQWGLLPSASAAWMLSQEKFIQDLDLFDELKFRVGYGVTGNADIDNYRYTTAYGAGKYSINNGVIATLQPGGTLGNPGLVWEKTASTNIGFDISMFTSRVNLSVDWYNQQSSNLLMTVKIPGHTGYGDQIQNVGEIRNRGWEFVLNTRNILSDKEGGFNWTTDFNISFNRSKVIEMAALTPGTFIVEKGKPLGQFYGYIYDGVYTTDDFTQDGDTYTLKQGVARPKTPGGTIKPGDIKYRPTAGEVDKDGNPVWDTDDRTVIGNAQADFTGGMVNTFTYKGFDLSVFMNFSVGNDILNQNKQQFMGPSAYAGMVNALGVMADRYQLIDPQTGREATLLSRLAELNPNQHSRNAIWSLAKRNDMSYSDNNSYYIEDGSFLRINTITLGYTIPQSAVRKIGLGSARVYATLNNPFVFTDYSGYDPEVASGSNADRAYNAGVDNAAYPRAKSFVVGVNLTF